MWDFVVKWGSSKNSLNKSSWREKREIEILNYEKVLNGDHFKEKTNIEVKREEIKFCEREKNFHLKWGGTWAEFEMNGKSFFNGVNVTNFNNIETKEKGVKASALKVMEGDEHDIVRMKIFKILFLNVLTLDPLWSFFMLHQYHLVTLAFIQQLFPSSDTF